MDIFDTPLDENLALEDRSKMIATLVKRAQAMHGELGDDSQGESKREATPRKKTPFEKALERCGEEYIALPNRLNTIPLDEELFKSIHLEIPVNLRFLLQRNNYYLIHVPITLFPNNDWEFDWLECKLAFNLDCPPEEQPTIHQIFPEQEWQEVVHAWETLEIGLDPNLEFKLDPTNIPNLEAWMEKLKIPVKASIQAKLASKSGLVMGPFEYHLKKAKVISQGTGGRLAVWRLYGKNNVLYRQPRMGIVLQVPKNIKNVSAEAHLFVQRTYPMPHFRGDWEDLIDQVGAKLRSFLDRGAPLKADNTWQQILPQG